MTACPRGHPSTDPDYCEVCGLEMVAPPAPPVAAACPACGAALDGRFCEACGQDSRGPVRPPQPPPPPAPVPWVATWRADRAWFDEVCAQMDADAAAALRFPEYAAERRFTLAGPQMTIGRSSATRGTDPAIDLKGLDPGVSAEHALLVRSPDGGWCLVDLDSTNGTAVAGHGPLTPHEPVPLADGAVVRLGVWTTITVGQSR